jgi:tetratricopeptide (TPR) repeat protein
MVKKVDHRSDIYGLGMVLFELITGHNAFEQMASLAAVPLLVEAMANERSRSAPSIRLIRPDASWGIESIIRKCLDPNPDQRYQRAAQLAEDLSRLIDQQPLKHVPELSRREQLEKWLSRHPRVIPSITMGALSVAILGIGGYSLSASQANLQAVQQRAFEAEGAEARELKAKFERGVQQALCLVNTHSTLQDHAQRGSKICVETLALYGILDRDDWQQQPAWHRLSSAEQTDLAEDARELLLLLALASSRDKNADVPSALQVLQRAKSIQGLKPSAAVLLTEAKLLREAEQFDRATEQEQAAAALHPESARDFYQLATTVLQSTLRDRHRHAIEHLRAAIKADARHYWSWMQKGLCHLELGEHHQALSDFSVCVGLSPDFAWGFFNRAFAFDQIGDKVGAISDYSNALDRDGSLLVAYHNRGVARLELRQFEPALSDFDRLLQNGALKGAASGTQSSIKATPELYALRGQALEGLGRHAEADAAFEDAFQDPVALIPTTRNQMACAYGFAVYRRLPEKAEHAFRSVDSTDPRFAEAAYGRGMLAVECGDDAAAIRHFKDSVAARPSFDEPRRFLAIVLARQSRLPEAVQAINESLTLNPTSGPSFYAAACVSALAAAQTSDPEQSRQVKLEALRLLSRAIEYGYGQHAASDSDLSALHELPEFQLLLNPSR